VHSSSWEPISEVRSVTCHMGSNSITCHPTQANAPQLNPSQAGRYSIYLPRRDGGWVDLGGWLCTKCLKVLGKVKNGAINEILCACVCVQESWAWHQCKRCRCQWSRVNQLINVMLWTDVAAAAVRRHEGRTTGVHHEPSTTNSSDHGPPRKVSN